MGLLQMAAVGAVGYVAYRYLKNEREHDSPVAFAAGEGSDTNFATVRNAGPAAMRSDPAQWDKQDQAMDESFPASDPPATY